MNEKWSSVCKGIEWLILNKKDSSISFLSILTVWNAYHISCHAKTQEIYEKPDIKKKLWLRWAGNVHQTVKWSKLSGNRIRKNEDLLWWCCEMKGQHRCRSESDGNRTESWIDENRERWRMMMPRLTKSCKTAEIETVLILPKWDRGEQVGYCLCKYVLRSGQKSKLLRDSKIYRAMKAQKVTKSVC